MNKICTKCEEPKSSSEFYKDKRTKDGLQSECKKCHYKQCKKYDQSPKGKLIHRRYLRSKEGRAVRIKSESKRRSTIKSVINDLTLGQWQQILDAQNNTCIGCIKKFTIGKRPQRDHIVPVVRGGGLTKDNIQALCQSCNSSKGTKSMSQFIKERDS